MYGLACDLSLVEEGLRLFDEVATVHISSLIQYNTILLPCLRIVCNERSERSLMGEAGLVRPVDKTI